MNSIGYNFEACLCTSNLDPLTNQTFGALIHSQKEKKLPYVLAIIQDHPDTNPLYLDASNLHKHCLKDLTNPITNEKINKIFFYVIAKPHNSFEFLGKVENASHDLYFKAAKNDPEAMLEIALNYQYLGCSYNDGEDFSKLRKKKDQWVIEERLENAQYQTNICTHDLSCEEDEDYEEEGFKWLKAAAKLGNAEAQHELAGCYFFSADTKKMQIKPFIGINALLNKAIP